MRKLRAFEGWRRIDQSRQAAEPDHDLSSVLFAALIAIATLMAMEFGVVTAFHKPAETNVQTAEVVPSASTTDFNTFFAQRIQLR